MKLVRPVMLATAAALLAVSAAGASAAPSKAPQTLVLTDDAGDANGVNDQGFAGPAGAATPGSQAALDIVKVTLADTGKTALVKGKKVFTCSGFTITIEMSGPVDESIPAIYRLLGATTANDGIFQLYWNNGIASSGTEVRYGAGDQDETVALNTPVTVAENKIIITVLTSDIKGFGDKLGDSITDFRVQDSISSGVSFVPQVDQLVSSSSFKMC